MFFLREAFKTQILLRLGHCPNLLGSLPSLSTKPNVSISLVTSVKASRTLTKGLDQGFDQGQDKELLTCDLKMLPDFDQLQLLIVTIFVRKIVNQTFTEKKNICKSILNHQYDKHSLSFQIYSNPNQNERCRYLVSASTHNKPPRNQKKW